MECCLGAIEQTASVSDWSTGAARLLQQTDISNLLVPNFVFHDVGPVLTCNSQYWSGGKLAFRISTAFILSSPNPSKCCIWNLQRFLFCGTATEVNFSYKIVEDGAWTPNRPDICHACWVSKSVQVVIHICLHYAAPRAKDRAALTVALRKTSALFQAQCRVTSCTYVKCGLSRSIRSSAGWESMKMIS